MLKLGSPNYHLWYIFWFNFTFCSHNMKVKKSRPRNHTPACDKCLESKHPPLNGPVCPNWWRTFRHCFVPSFVYKIQWSESSSLCPPHSSFKHQATQLGAIQMDADGLESLLMQPQCKQFNDRVWMSMVTGPQHFLYLRKGSAAVIKTGLILFLFDSMANLPT